MSSQSARAVAPVRRPTGLTGDLAWSPHCRRCSTRPSASLPAPGSRSWNVRARSACPLHARGQALACGGRHGRRLPARHTRRLRCAGSRLRSARHVGRRGDANRRAAHIRLRRRQWAAIAFLVAARESNDGRYRRWHPAFSRLATCGCAAAGRLASMRIHLSAKSVWPWRRAYRPMTWRASPTSTLWPARVWRMLRAQV